MVRLYSFAWILVSLLSLALAAPLQADITPSGDVDPTDHSWWAGGGSSSITAYIGKIGVGSVTVDLDSDLSSDRGYIGYESGATGEVAVDGSGSTWANSDDLFVGYYGQGTLNITSGGATNNNDAALIGYKSGSTGLVTVDGIGSTWTNSNNLWVGYYGQGTLNITNGGAVSNAFGYIGHKAGSTGEVTVDGSGSTWTNNGCLRVGSSGHGTLNITNGGAVSNTDGYIGYYSGSVGEVTVDGSGSTWTCDGDLLIVGIFGSGTLNITNGGAVSGSHGVIGNESGSASVVTVDGSGSTWTCDGNLFAGNYGRGTLNISNGGAVSNNGGYIGNEPGSVGVVTVDGSGSTWTNNGILYVGHGGTGMSTQTGGTTTISSELHLGYESGSQGTYTLSGGTLNVGGDIRGGSGSSEFVLDGGTLNLSGAIGSVDTFIVGKDSTASYTQTGGTNTVSKLYLGYNSGSDGTVTVDGSGSTWTNDRRLYVGYYGQGTLNITNGGAVSNSSGFIGYEAGSTGVVTVGGSGSTWACCGSHYFDGLYVGYSGQGTLNITNGGAVNVTGDTWIARYNGSAGEIHFDGGTLTTKSLFAGATQLTGTGTINIHGLVSDVNLLFDSAHGPNQTLTLNSQPDQNITINLTQDSTGYLGAGYAGNGTLAIRDGVSVDSRYGYIGYKAGATGVVTVDGSGSTWTSGSLYVGYYGQGTLNITNGGVVSNYSGYIGCEAGSTGVVAVDGSGSTWTSSGLSLSVGCNGHGTLNITNGGAVSNKSGYIGDCSGSTGVVTVDGSGSTWTNSSNLIVGCEGQGTLNITNGGSVAVGDMLKVWGLGTVNLTGGTLTADSINHTYGGAFNFTGGRLNVGTFIGHLVNNGGTLAPGTSPGITNIQGDYTQEAGGSLEIEIGGLFPGYQHDQVILTGTASLAGTLELGLIGEYVPDFYDEFEIVTAGTLNGTFDLITGVAVDPDMYLAVVYNADKVTIVAALPGDANLEGNVDDSDLSILLSNFGDSGAWSAGDFNGNGNIGDADLSILLSNFGSTSTMSEAVPEPATLLLLCSATISVVLKRRRKSQA